MHGRPPTALKPLGTLAAQPKISLAHRPTPLESCDRLREVLGGPAIWLKRDDCTGLAGGGNKTRKLEFLLGRALADGADGVITFGALQSNHARQTAAACARTRLSCDLVLTRAVPLTDEHYTRSGNVLLDRLFGATLHVVDDNDAAARRFGEVLEQASSDGRSLFTIVPGGSDVVGTLGYVDAGLELAYQQRERRIDARRIVVAASTCGTAAGLVVGCALAGLGAVVDVVCVYRPGAETETALRTLIAETTAFLGLDAAPDRWSVTDRTLGPGYGIPTPQGLEAIDLLARTEGVLLDPVYTAKAFAHLIGLVREGLGDDVVFVHTGGAPGLSAYVPALSRPFD